MSRRRAAKKREILPDSRFESELVAKFINHVMTQGKKSIAARIVYNALEMVGHKMTLEEMKERGIEIIDEPKELCIFKQTLENLYPSVEVRSRRVGGATYQVPVEIRPARRITLAMRILRDSARTRKEKTMQQRLANEMTDVLNHRGIAIKKLNDMLRMAEANRAFAHYRWTERRD